MALSVTVEDGPVACNQSMNIGNLSLIGVSTCTSTSL